MAALFALYYIVLQYSLHWKVGSTFSTFSFFFLCFVCTWIGGERRGEEGRGEDRVRYLGQVMVIVATVAIMPKAEEDQQSRSHGHRYRLKISIVPST